MLLKVRAVRRIWFVLQILPHFFTVAFSDVGLGSEEGRTLIWGKVRRFFLSLFPALARSLQKQHGLQGSCRSCGASCKLLFQCPHWDDLSKLCTVYDDRPAVCRLYPITPADIRDRDLVLAKRPCGFQFADSPQPALLPLRIGRDRKTED